jgi:hypothetical protein
VLEKIWRLNGLTNAVALLLHLFFGEAEVGTVALPEGALLQQPGHALATYPGDLLDGVPVVHEDEPPGLAVEVRRGHGGDLD